MVFSLIHRPPRLDWLNMTLSDVDELDEGLAEALWERLKEAREKTIDALRAEARSGARRGL